MAFFGWKSKTNPTASLGDVPPNDVPQHIAVIMDGNGRWAQAKGMPRIEGHRRGANAVREISEACRELGVRYLTLYCFSNENWKRPKEELDFLMGLLKSYLINERANLEKNDIKLTVIGRRQGIPAEVQAEMDHSIEISKHRTSLTLCLAINYGGRQEIVDAVRALAHQVQLGSIKPEEIDEASIQQHLYTADMPDPDLLIRTSGEMRISNYLLWQISYSELWVTEKPWPEFGRRDLVRAIEEYGQRDRRFGGIAPPPSIE